MRALFQYLTLDSSFQVNQTIDTKESRDTYKVVKQNWEHKREQSAAGAARAEVEESA